MTRKPILLKPEDLSTFISLKYTCVVQATIGNNAEFNATLFNRLRAYINFPFTIGSINIEQVGDEPFIQILIREQMKGIGLVASDTLLPGYYLFKNGTLAAYHPGTFDVSRLDPESLKTTMKIATGVSILTALFLRSADLGFRMFLKLSEVPTGMNIFQFFKEVLEAKKKVDVLKKQQVIFMNEIENAYALLEVSSFVTDQEIKDAYRKKIIDCHPDRNPGNIEASTKLTVKVIEAYELIMAQRRATKVEV